jgi:hypothetical protein
MILTRWFLVVPPKEKECVNKFEINLMNKKYMKYMKIFKKGLIQHSKYPIGVLIMFVKKKMVPYKCVLIIVD